MVRIRHEKGGQGIGPYWWPEDNPVCEVDEALARDLLANPWGYSLEPDPQPEPEDDGNGEDDGGEQDPPGPDPEGGEGEGGTGEQGKPPAKPAARGRKPAGTPKA